ncbi:hypothetical protein PUMCH_002653 [Australozyma saopauloensis]|uniref:AP complex subunit beta n=1 Tax=Australozyma saopauloensis TaxID=291208 RepID=A0AAX4HAG4_9ASCO|nr:hypothetical protein PUMCH_002653 [[Candida] saopauloensis]
MSLEKKIINFLKGPKKGEAYELKAGLVSQYKHERKDAIQRVIQAMTIGKDVSALFPDVLKNIATYDLEQKKLVYLYLMNYAKSNPELCILAVNTFVQDTEDPNPLVRALAIRTMGCIRVERMVDYMEIPLRRTLEDDNPYVRKTAAICVAKLFDLNAEMCIELGFFDALKKLLQDLNPMVVANALNALHEIKDMNHDQNLKVLTVDADLVKLLLACLNECSEWGRITILSYLAEYPSPDPEETLHLIERVIPQLQHVNPSVVLSSIKVVVHHLDGLANQAQKTSFLKKLSAPMVSLVSLPIPEAQYVGLKNIRIILEKYPSCLSKELRVFFIKYSDPLYLKLEKLDILIRLASDSNSALLLSELKEYAMEFEPTLITKAVHAIGAVAIKLSDSVIPAVNLLVTLMDQRGGEFIINESSVILTQILRRYPGRNDLITLIVPVISHHVEQLTSNPALSGYVFLLGEYPKYFTSLREKLQLLTDEFLEYDASLQLSIITAVVKVCAKVNKTGYSLLLQAVLDKATKECDNADVRDKAFLYWRFLSSSSQDEQDRLLNAQLPPIKTIIPSFNPAVLEDLINELSTLSSVYHKPASTFIVSDEHKSKEKKSRRSSNKSDISDLANIAKQEIINNAKNENLLDFDDDEPLPLTSSGPTSAMDELDDLFSIPTTPQPKTGASKQDIMDLFGSSSSSAPSSMPQAKPTAKINSDLLDLI